MDLLSLTLGAMFVAIAIHLGLRGGIPHLRSPHKDDYKRVTKDLAMRERRRLAKLARGRSRIAAPEDEGRAQTIARHVLSSDMFETNAWNWLYLGLGVLAGGVALWEWWDPVDLNPGELIPMQAIVALVFGSQGAWNMRLRSALLETARVNGWTLPDENREVRPPLPKGTG